MTERSSVERPFVSIGGAPSSGTTLLADLLDSVPGMACDPELGCLSIAEAYAWSDEFVDAAMADSVFPSLSLYSAPRTFFNTKYADLLEFDDRRLRSMVASSRSLPDFMDAYRRHRSAVRGREIDVMVEKTPVNIATADLFLGQFPNGLFIHVVRDPRQTVGSLSARGFGLAESVAAWTQQVARGVPLLAHPRVLTVRYEQLVERPFEIAAEIARRVGIEVEPAVISASFADNEFRANLPRVKSWRTATYDGTVRPAGDDRLTEMSRAWVERQSIWTAHPDWGLQFHVSVSYLAHRMGLDARSVSKARFDLARLRSIFRQFAAADAAYERCFSVTEPKSVVGIGHRLGKTSLSEWRAFLDSARPWVPIPTLEQIALQAAERQAHAKAQRRKPTTTEHGETA